MQAGAVKCEAVADEIGPAFCDYSFDRTHALQAIQQRWFRNGQWKVRKIENKVNVECLATMIYT